MVKPFLYPTPIDIIVLLEFSHYLRRSFSNLIRINPYGSIIWHAELPQATENDAYVDVELKDGILMAWSWSGYRTVISPDSGRIVQKTITK